MTNLQVSLHSHKNTANNGTGRDYISLHTTILTHFMCMYVCRRYSMSYVRLYAPHVGHLFRQSFTRAYHRIVIYHDVSNFVHQSRSNHTSHFHRIYFNFMLPLAYPAINTIHKCEYQHNPGTSLLNGHYL